MRRDGVRGAQQVPLCMFEEGKRAWTALETASRTMRSGPVVAGSLADVYRSAAVDAEAVFRIVDQAGHHGGDDGIVECAAQAACLVAVCKLALQQPTEALSALTSGRDAPVRPRYLQLLYYMSKQWSFC